MARSGAVVAAAVIAALAGCSGKLDLVIRYEGFINRLDPSEFDEVQACWESADGTRRVNGELLTGTAVYDGAPLLVGVPWRMPGRFTLEATSNPYGYVCGASGEVVARAGEVEIIVHPVADGCVFNVTTMFECAD